MYKLEQLLNKIEQYNFESEGGPLTNCLEWQELKKELQPLLLQADTMCSSTHYFSPSEDNSRFCNRCGKYFTDEVHVRG